MNNEERTAAGVAPEECFPQADEPCCGASAPSPTEQPAAQADEAGASAPQAQTAGKGSSVKKVVNIVLTTLGLTAVAFLFFVAVTLAVDKFVRKSPVPSFFGVSTLIVTTGSMSGTIEAGDMIVIQRANEYKVGDVITFLPVGDTIPTTHRIVRILDGAYFTKGDATNAEDTLSVTKDRIVGKVTKTVPHVGLFFQWIKDGNGWLYLVAAAVVVIGGVVLLKRVSDPKA